MDSQGFEPKATVSLTNSRTSRWWLSPHLSVVSMHRTSARLPGWLQKWRKLWGIWVDSDWLYWVCEVREVNGWFREAGCSAMMRAWCRYCYCNRTFLPRAGLKLGWSIILGYSTSRTCNLKNHIDVFYAIIVFFLHSGFPLANFILTDLTRWMYHSKRNT